MSSVKLWWRAVRPFAFTASVVPVLLGSSIAAALNVDLVFNWGYFVLAILGAMLVHSGTNLINDYYDYKSGVDRKGTYGSSGLLVSKMMAPAQTFKGAIVTFSLAVIVALYFVAILDNKAFFIGLCAFGLFSGIFYTATPLSLKFRALGDIQVFVSMGILMTVGAYFIQTQEFSWMPVLYAIPISLLVDAILHGNNLRDIADDREAGISTIAIILGEKGASLLYYFLILGAYAAIILLMVIDDLHPIALITFLSFPIAIKLVKMVKNKASVPKEVFAMIDAGTAQLHMAVGCLMSISFILQRAFF